MTRFATLAKLLLVIATASLLAACASSPVQYTHYDRSVDFTSYKTYGFYPELATDKQGYSTLITEYFKRAISAEMNQLGYAYSDNNPDLLVNFAMSIEDRSEVQSSGASFGYFSYRHGLYGVWPLYDQDVRTVNYKEGTANVDLIDADRKRLVWESVAEGRLSKKAMNNPEDTIRNAVAEMFKGHPLSPRDDLR